MNVGHPSETPSFVVAIASATDMPRPTIEAANNNAAFRSRIPTLGPFRLARPLYFFGDIVNFSPLAFGHWPF